MSERLVYCEDAVSWLQKTPCAAGSALVASLPDISEFPSYTLEQWKEWFQSTARLVLECTPADGVTVFYQSDIKYEGTWVDKAHLCQRAAETCGSRLLWHKIASRVEPGQATFGRPGYSHILCFSKNVRADPAKSSADILPDLGEKTWERGMGLEACLMIAKFVVTQTTCNTLINPFCGQGSMLAAAEVLGLNAIGIERSPKRCQAAKNLKLNMDEKRWSSATEAQ